MPEPSDQALRDSMLALLNERRLTPEGRAALEAIVQRPDRYFDPDSRSPRPAVSPWILRTVDALPGGLFSGHYDGDGVGHVEWMSAHLAEILGIDPDEPGDTAAMARKLRVDQPELLHERITTSALEQETLTYDVRVIDAAGRPRWMRVVTVFEPPEGERYPFMTLVFDATGIRQTGEALLRSDASFRAMLRGSRSAFALIDPDHRLLWFNDVAVRYADNMGWRVPEVGASMFDIFDRAFYAYYLRARQKVWQGQMVERRMTFQTRHGQAPTLDIAFLPVRRPSGEIFAVGFTGSDVTRQVAAEQAQRESERILLRLPVGVATVDRRGVIQRWRAAAPAMFDLPPASAEGTDLGDLLVLEERQRAWPQIVEALAEGRDLRLEAEARRPDGAQIPVQLTLSALPEPAGHMVVVLEDITDRRALQRQVIESQKMEAVGLFAAGLAHDFNNLLAAIVGHTAMLDLDMQPDDPLRAEIEGIEQTTGRAATLVRSMLGLARQRPGGARTIDLVALAQRAQPLLSRVAGSMCRVVVRIDVESLAVRVDPVQLEQVLVNLVVNARDASPSGGTIGITVGGAVLDHERARAMTMMPGRVARIDVVDEGEGIPPEIVARVFDPFFTTKTEGRGTGLGLAICSQILRASGGEIRLSSEPGRGTRVTLWLPASPDVPVPRAADEGVAMVGGDESILLVEDVVDLRQVWSRLLERLGYRVQCASDGVEAIDLLDRGRGFDILVSDVVMPRVGGVAVARRFRELHPGRPILMVSAYPGDAFDTRSLLDLDARLVRKPLTGPALARHIRKLLSA